MLWVLLQISYTFQQCKHFENRLRFDKVMESLKVETFLRYSVEEQKARNIAKMLT